MAAFVKQFDLDGVDVDYEVLKIDSSFRLNDECIVKGF